MSRSSNSSNRNLSLICFGCVKKNRGSITLIESEDIHPLDPYRSALIIAREDRGYHCLVNPHYYKKDIKDAEKKTSSVSNSSSSSSSSSADDNNNNKNNNNNNNNRSTRSISDKPLPFYFLNNTAADPERQKRSPQKIYCNRCDTDIGNVVITELGTKKRSTKIIGFDGKKTRLYPVERNKEIADRAKWIHRIEESGTRFNFLSEDKLEELSNHPPSNIFPMSSHSSDEDESDEEAGDDDEGTMNTLVSSFNTHL